MQQTHTFITPHVAGLYVASAVFENYTSSVFRGTLEAAESWRSKVAGGSNVHATALRHSAVKVDFFDPKVNKPVSCNLVEALQVSDYAARADTAAVDALCPPGHSCIIAADMTTKNSDMCRLYVLFQNFKRYLIGEVDDTDMCRFLFAGTNKRKKEADAIRLFADLRGSNDIVDKFLDTMLLSNKKPSVDCIHFKRVLSASDCIDYTVWWRVMAHSRQLLKMPTVDDRELDCSDLAMRGITLTPEQKSKHCAALLEAVGDNIKWAKKNEFDAQFVITSREHVARVFSRICDWESYCK